MIDQCRSRKQCLLAISKRSSKEPGRFMSFPSSSFELVVFLESIWMTTLFLGICMLPSSIELVSHVSSIWTLWDSLQETRLWLSLAEPCSSTPAADSTCCSFIFCKRSQEEWGEVWLPAKKFGIDTWQMQKNTSTRLFITVFASSTLSLIKFITVVLLNLTTCVSSTVRAVNGCGLQHKTPISPNTSPAPSLPWTYWTHTQTHFEGHALVWKSRPK